MEYIKIFIKAIGWNWVRVPGIIFSVLPVTYAFGVYEGWLPVMDLSKTFLVEFAIVVILLWFLGGLLHFSVLQSREVAHYYKSHDETGKYNIPIKQAVQFIHDYLAKTESADKEHDRYSRALAKMRGLGWGGTLKIIGRLYDSEDGTYSEYEKPIPAGFWEKNRLNIERVANDINTLPQTIVDPKFDIPQDHQDEWGHIYVNGETLKAMFKIEE